MISKYSKEQYGTIPNDYVDEWFISSKLNCLLPGNKQNKIEPITGLHSLCGQLLTFSFVVQAENAIKCYIIWNGQTR